MNLADFDRGVEGSYTKPRQLWTRFLELRCPCKASMEVCIADIPAFRSGFKAANDPKVALRMSSNGSEKSMWRPQSFWGSRTEVLLSCAGYHQAGKVPRKTKRLTLIHRGVLYNQRVFFFRLSDFLVGVDGILGEFNLVRSFRSHSFPSLMNLCRLLILLLEIGCAFLVNWKLCSNIFIVSSCL